VLDPGSPGSCGRRQRREVVPARSGRTVAAANVKVELGDAEFLADGDPHAVAPIGVGEALLKGIDASVPHPPSVLSTGANIDRNYRGKGLQLKFTVEDEGVFTMPWSATVTYGRDASPNWEESVCAKNVQHDYQELHYSDKDAHPPMADKPDF
jgi:hypothetical protein